VIEHAGHDVAVDGVKDEQDGEDEQRQVALARIFDDQQRHHAADDEIGRVIHAGALGAQRDVIGGHVIGAIGAEQAISRRDEVVRRFRQLRIK